MRENGKTLEQSGSGNHILPSLNPSQTINPCLEKPPLNPQYIGLEPTNEPKSDENLDKSEPTRIISLHLVGYDDF